MDYNIDVKAIETTSSLFEEFIKGDMLYVDKSEHAYRMLTMKGSTTFLFMARPRRFGKSLFVSMLESALMGKREMFEGLYLGSSDYDFHPYPVIHLDMSDLPFHNGVDEFSKELNRLLEEQAARYGLGIDHDADPGSNLRAIIKEIHERTGERVAILIDEYDNPLTSTLDAREGKEIREIVRDFYARLKPSAARIRFLFITGITRFSNQSIFSKLNNLRDLTMDKEYATAFGYTQQELESYFSEALDAKTLSGLRRWYDGYRFADGSEKVYNPISINMYFSTGNGFEPYWGRTAASKAVVEAARRAKLSFLPDEVKKIPLSSIYSFMADDLVSEDATAESVYAYLCMAGYLTIERIEGKYAYLCIPNFEVEGILCDVIATLYLGPSAERFDDRITGYLSSCDFPSFMAEMQDLIRVPQYGMMKSEESYQALIYTVLRKVADIDIRSEVRTAIGRADLMIFIGQKLFIIELKRDKSAEEAMAQIRDRRYWDGYADRDIYLIGINIDTSKDRELTYIAEHL